MMSSAKFKVSCEQFWSVLDPILLSFSPSTSFSSHSAAAEILLQFFAALLFRIVLWVVGPCPCRCWWWCHVCTCFGFE